MQSIGQILKAARERRQISIADVVVATKMSSTFVKAIEADDFDALVAPVYARGFIKLYAVCVGLDPMPLLKQFDVSSQATPAPAPPPSETPPRKGSVAYAGKLKPPRLQQSGPLPRQGATGKPEQEKASGRSPDTMRPPAAPRTAMRVGSMAGRKVFSPAALASLLAGRLSALNRMFSAHIQRPQFKLPGRVRQYLSLPVIVWRRIFIVAFVVLLIIAASLAWEWSHRELSTTDACRWLAEPPAPYLNVEARPASPGR
ncbi:MAG: helix-turn-helix domain-containing protein [Kiritimatiellaeota bacterium]|nr:helix-turn-helix domain-containing protein [Kiritimatiellota bacterium]